MTSNPVKQQTSNNDTLGKRASTALGSALAPARKRQRMDEFVHNQNDGQNNNHNNSNSNNENVESKQSKELRLFYFL